MTDGSGDEGARLRERAVRVASAAYSAAHGHPLEHPAAGGVRWRTSTLAVVAGAVVLACLLGAVGVRAVAQPGPGATLAPSTAPLVVADGEVDDGSGRGAPAALGEGPGAGGGGPVDDVPGAGAGGDGAASGGPGGRSVVVHVVGAVQVPGLVVLHAGARVADAVELAGGPSDDADLAGLNLARPVQDGEQIRVPLPGEVVPETAPPEVGPGDSGGVPPAGGRVDVNRASADQLVALPGIGPVLAERIVAHRTTEGPFASVDALTAVSGIGPRVLERLRDHVVVDGR